MWIQHDGKTTKILVISNVIEKADLIGYHGN